MNDLNENITEHLSDETIEIMRSSDRGVVEELIQYAMVEDMVRQYRALDDNFKDMFEDLIEE